MHSFKSALSSGTKPLRNVSFQSIYDSLCCRCCHWPFVCNGLSSFNFWFQTFWCMSVPPPVGPIRSQFLSGFSNLQHDLMHFFFNICDTYFQASTFHPWVWVHYCTILVLLNFWVRLIHHGWRWWCLYNNGGWWLWVLTHSARHAHDLLATSFYPSMFLYYDSTS